MLWTVLIPAKALPTAKSRLTAATSDPGAHRRLVEAIRHDTVDAARAAAAVARVVAVVDRPTDLAGADHTLVQTTPGLNAAVREGAAFARRHWPDDGVAALVGDLAALRGAELDDALTRAATLGLGYVADHDGTGTTLLAAAAGHVLEPAFGAGSAGRHARVAAAIAAGPGLRHDIDTPDDLRAAAGLGLGPATEAAVAGTPWAATGDTSCTA